MGRKEPCDGCSKNRRLDDMHTCGWCGCEKYCDKCVKDYLIFYQHENGDYGYVGSDCERVYGRAGIRVISRPTK